MRIESYNVRMDSAGMKNSNTTRKFQVALQGQSGVWNAPKNSFANTYSALAEGEGQESDKVQEQPKRGDDVWDRFNAINMRKIDRLNSSPTGGRDLQSVKQQFVLYLWRIFFGDESAKSLSEKYGLEDMNQYKQTQEVPNYQTIEIYGINEYHSIETQALSFQTQGHVTTEDGRVIDFNFGVEMTSSFEQYYREEGKDVIRMCDPLVLNFTGDVADLSDTKFIFDLDCDGEAEEISMLKSGNGFLALDKNSDGIINDGSELFGTKTGDGFGDLALYDYDGNGWIDENDSVFDNLKIWYKDDTGEDKLMNLKEAGVGAIYLGNATTDYNLRSAESFSVNGAIRRAGIFLYENAVAGSIVHLDIAN